MTAQSNLVSIIVPMYNASKYIEATVNSVLEQTHTNWELILIDDGSKDNSVEVAKKFTGNEKIFLLQHPNGENRGVAKTRALGISESKGEYVAFLDADDMFLPYKLEKQIKIFLENEDIILTHSKIELLNDTKYNFSYEFKVAEQDLKYDMRELDIWLKKNPICNSSVLVKKSVLTSVHFEYPQLFQHEDWLVWSLLSRLGKFYYQDEPQTIYRLHNTSATGNIQKNLLITPYSKIEYLISFFLSENDKMLGNKVINEIKEALVNLAELYTTQQNSITRIGDFRLGLSADTDSAHYIEKYNALEEKYNILLKENKQLSHLKRSWLFRLQKYLTGTKTNK